MTWKILVVSVTVTALQGSDTQADLFALGVLTVTLLVQAFWKVSELKTNT